MANKASNEDYPVIETSGKNIMKKEIQRNDQITSFDKTIIINTYFGLESVTYTHKPVSLKFVRQLEENNNKMINDCAKQLKMTHEKFIKMIEKGNIYFNDK